MSSIAEIKQKYSTDGGAVSVTVDLESMREGAKNTLSEAESCVRDFVRAAERGVLRSDKEWINRRKSSIANNISEQKRKLSMAQKYIDEVKGLLDKAGAKLAEAK